MRAGRGGSGRRGTGTRICRAAIAAAVAGASLAALVTVTAGPAAALPGDRLVNPVTGTNVGDCTVNKCRTIVYAHTQAVAGNRIVLDPGTYLEKPVITKAITLEGAGAATTLIGAATVVAGNALQVNAGAANTVTINGVTIRSGVGGLFVNTGNVVVNDSIITGNIGTTVGAGVIVNVAPNQVTLKNSTVSNNSANNGAGIYTFGGKITMTGGQVAGNTTTAIAGNTSSGFGGGIYNASTVAPSGLTLDGVTVSGNRALTAGTVPGNGGGIFNNGTATITDTSVTGNSANNGGGILNLSFVATGGKLALTGGEVSGNTATAIAGNTGTGFGGGVYSLSVNATPLTISGATLDGNKAVPAGTVIGTGGGVYTATPSTITGGASITNNTASNGGGVFNASALTLAASTVAENDASSLAGVAASGQGGGLHNTSAGVVTATGATVSSNTAANGGGIYNVGKVTASGGEVSTNTVTSGAAGTGSGGGIYNLSSAAPQSLLLSAVSVSGNQALFGGGATPAGQGGGIFHLTGTAVLNDGTVVNDNSATGGYGGGIENVDGTLSMTGGEIRNNTVTPTAGNTATGWGGGVFNAPLFTAASTVNLTGVTIEGNKALTNGTTGGSGGGIANAGTATVNTSPITGNEAVVGGGVYNSRLFLANTPAASFTELEISDNTVTSVSATTGFGAGALSVTPSQLTLTRVTMAANDAALGGSAITASGPTILRNSTVNGNTSGSTIGAIFVSGATTLDNDTIVGNSATGANNVGGIVRSAGTTTVTGSIVALNGANCAGTVADGGYNLTDTASPTAGACPFTSNAVIGDPQLNPLGSNGGPTPTMLPKNNSPAINKIPVGPVCPSIDQRGVTRPRGTNCDIGSVELEGIVAPTLVGPDNALFVIGTPNSVGFTYTGVPTPTLSTSGDALPTGVTLTDNNDGTATLGGTAATGTAGVYEFTITAANGELPDATIDFTLTVIAPLTITTTALPDGEVNMPYNATLQATGGTTPYTWSIDSGTLPAGLSLNAATGAITGTPTGPEGPSTFTVRVTDSTDPAQTDTQELTLSIKTATTLSVDPAILRLTLPSLKLSVINASARLTKAPGAIPVPGQTIRFKVGAQNLCTAVTDANGFAKCPPVNVNGILSVILAGGYDAFFDGTATLKPSSGHGGLVSG